MANAPTITDEFAGWRRWSPPPRHRCSSCGRTRPGAETLRAVFYCCTDAAPHDDERPEKGYILDRSGEPERSRPRLRNEERMGHDHDQEHRTSWDGRRRTGSDVHRGGAGRATGRRCGDLHRGDAAAMSDPA
ncbi:hypothetical protein NS334_03385 [Sphingomonas endophytica]|uniref:Uncharacterized protein n=1 Tax=Sphingomonas endophytica TaxID=869719 RepID=A0A147I850_9SPHN|nr:hypothetical protein NS334_03385 [Sphingomonas endophytica]